MEVRSPFALIPQFKKMRNQPTSQLTEQPMDGKTDPNIESFVRTKNDPINDFVNFARVAAMLYHYLFKPKLTHGNGPCIGHLGP